MRNTLKYLFCIGYLLVSHNALCEVVITDVTARQRYPWNGKVDISYTVSGVEKKANDAGLIARLRISSVDLTSSTTNVATTLSGDLSLSDGAHKVVWDMNAQGLTFKSTNVVFTVSCEVTPALYCIVDLSAGANATSYPISYTNEIPDGSWSDEYKTTKLVLRRIESGTCSGVTVAEPYYIGVFEVTQKQYELITGKKPSYFSGNDMRPVECVPYNAIRGSNKGAQYPSSTDVDDNSCVGKLRTRTGLHFDLPTEAQWEYACRAGTTTTYSYGDSANGDYMWYNLNSGNCTHDVGTRKPNVWGLYDMHGNVWEWCLEWGPGYTGSARVMRGGGWVNFADYCTSSYRGYTNPSNAHYFYGFRLVRTLSKDMAIVGSTDTRSVDLTTGTRVAAETEMLTYSTEWEGAAGEGATAVVAVDGVTISEQPGSGMVMWTPTRDGTYELTHKVMNGDEQVGETLTATFVAEGLNPKMPVIKPASGTTFGTTSMTVSMTCASEGVTIHYTTDGSVPTMESPTYKKFKIYGKTTVKAIAFYEDGTPSEMAVAEYARGQCDDPVITPKDSAVFVHPATQVVTIENPGTNGVIRYTVDGSEPTANSPVYEGAFTIDETTTIKAKVFSDDFFDSQVVTSTITCVWQQVATPEIAAQAQFTGSKQKVAISCATDGTVVRYTTNGAEPNSHSTKYVKPFYVMESATIKAFATKTDWTKSDTASFAIAKVWGIGDTMGKPDHAFATSGDVGFERVDDDTATRGESMRSGEIGNEERSVLSTTLIGPGTLTFKWKTSCEEDNEYEWDHAEFRVNGVLKGRLNGETDWVSVSQRIEGEGTNTVTWTYIKDDVEGAGEDCLWVSEYAWASDYTTTQTTGVPVPYDWLREKSRDIVDEYDNYEKVTKQSAYNPKYTVEQCYVAGLDPESTTNEFRSAIEMVNGFPSISWDPDKKSERTYKIWGSTNLVDGGAWHCPTNALDRFFKVTVEMP